MTGQILHVHVGLPKTGTSALQLFLVRNRDRLREAGVFLPRAGQREDGPHHTLVSRLAGFAGRNRRGHVDALAAEIRASGAPQAVISSEYSLMLLRTSMLGRSLRRLAAQGFDLRFHAFVRPQADYLNSGYAELLRSTLTYRDFDDFLRQRARAGRRDFGTILAPLARLSRGPVTVHPYNGPTRRDGVWWPFLAGMGVEAGARDGWAIPGEINPTLGPVGVHVVSEVIRRIERRGLVRGFRNRQALRDSLSAATRRFPAEAERFCGLTNALRDEIWTACAAGNAAFARTHWGRDWDEVFAEERVRDCQRNIYDPETATPVRAALAGAMMEIAWAETDRAVRRYEARSASRRLADRLMDPFDRLLDLTMRLALTYG